MFGITSAGLNKDIESAVSMFTKAVNKLDDTASKATNMANKIRSLIS